MSVYAEFDYTNDKFTLELSADALYGLVHILDVTILEDDDDKLVNTAIKFQQALRDFIPLTANLESLDVIDIEIGVSASIYNPAPGTFDWMYEEKEGI